jgi:predicted RND superfamily exporter protein
LPISSKRRAVEWLLDHRIVVLAAVSLATLLLLLPLRDPRVLFADSKSHKPDEGEKVEPERMLLIVRADDVFSREVLAYVRATSDAVEREVQKLHWEEKERGKSRVTSLSTVSEVALEDGSITVSPFLSEIPADAETLRRKKAKALSNPLWKHNLISADATVTAINIELPPLIRGSRDADVIVEKVRKLAEERKPDGVEVFLTGMSPLFVDTMGSAKKDFARFSGLTMLLMAALLFLAFRTLRGVLVPMGVTFLAVLWTLGLMAATGYTISAVGAMLPTLIGVVCFSDAVHVMGHYYEQAQGGAGRREVLVDTMEHMLVACFLTSLTTAIAFGSLATAELSSVKEFGVWAAIGIMLGYCLINALTPIILSWLPLPSARVQRRYEGSLCSRLLTWTVRINRVRGPWVLAVVGILIVLSVIAARKLRVETSVACFLPKSAPSMQAFAISQKKLAGFGSVEVDLTGPKGCFRKPWGLKEVQKVERFLEDKCQDKVKVAHSIVDLLQWTHECVEETDEDLLSDPDAAGLIAEYWYLFSNSENANFLARFLKEGKNEEGTGGSGKVVATARVSARLRVPGSGEKLEFVNELKKYLATNLDKRLRYSISGEADRIHKQIESVLDSLTHSFGWTLLFITILMSWQLRSLKSGLLSMIPNLLPVIMTLGIMGAGDVSLNFGTVMIASIAIGIAVDDTIHFMVRYRRELQADPDRDKAVENTIMQSGRAMVFTSITMTAGCALFLLSGFAPSRQFGFLMAFTMITALIADLLVLPYLAKTFKM